MPIDPVKIPQNVYIEDRIVGPLTLKQIIIVGAGCGLSYALWSVMTQAQGGNIGIPLTVIVWSPGALSAVFAFFKLNDLTLFQLALLTFERMNKAPVRTWTPRKGITVNIRTFTTNDAPKREQVDLDAKKAMRIDAISTSLDTAMDRKPGDDWYDTEDGPAPNANTDTSQENKAQAARAVDPSRIAADPLASGQPVDGIVPRAAVSLMTPRSPAR
jgi:hypothetical protein